MRFRDKVVIVTGSGSGIGRALAIRFASEGAKVGVVDQLGDRAQSVIAEIQESGGKAMAQHADVSSGSDVESMAATVTKELGPVDILVNNAAIGEGDDVVNMEEPVWERDVDIVLKSVFLCSKAVLPSMIQRGGGVIINIASVNGIIALGNEAYSAAKAGVISLTQSIAVRYGVHGVRCNAVAPGTIRTPSWEKRVDRDPLVFQRLVKWYPLGRIGEPDDVANAVLFLASDEASWITGSVLCVDGGLLAGNLAMTRDILAESAGRELNP